MLETALTPRTRRILLTGFAGWFVFTLFVLMFSPASIRSIESRLEVNAAEALACTERDPRDCVSHDWAQVRVDGQRAVITGGAPNRNARADAIMRVQGSSWSGGVVAGGITRVVDATTDARTDRGFVFVADAANSQVTIHGDASDAAARDAIERFAATNFSSGASSDLTLIPGGAPSRDWDEAAMRLLGQLARLERGAVVLDAEQGGLYGEAANPQNAQSIASALASMPEPFSAAYVIIPAGAEPLTSIADQAACSAVIQAARGRTLLRFDRGGAMLSPLSMIALRRIAGAFGHCPDTMRLQLLIDLADDDRALADERSLASITVLADGGVDESRIDIRIAEDQLRDLVVSVSAVEE